MNSDDMSLPMLDEIFTTLLVFLDSANREIVKSALGFVKLAIHIYPTDMIQKNLQPTIETLLSWSHSNKNHFKLKVRYICERTIRKFGFETVVACVEGNEDGKKVLMNIKKRREHARKKKQSAADEQDEEVKKKNIIILFSFSQYLIYVDLTTLCN
jgi:ribosomal RNA-processing protein 12